MLSSLDVSQFLFLLRQMPARMEETGSSDNWFCRCGVSQGYGHPSFSSRNKSEAGAAVLEGTALALVAVVLPFPGLQS